MSYADTVNKQYKVTTSHFISLRERLSESVAAGTELMLDGMVAEFKRRHKSWKKYTDLNLCRAIMVPMDKILIDTTMQRKVNFKHILNILQYFEETMVMAIQVYEDPEKPGYYIAWDGQHTAIVLYILATKLFGQRIAELMVPVVIYSVKQKAEIRRNFILLNGDAKDPLEFIDLWKQMVCGVLLDGATDKAWRQAAEKQAHFERAGLFATDAKFNDKDEAGAFSLLADTIMSKSEKSLKPVDVTRMFADYWIALGKPERSVDAKEARILYEYFDACVRDNIAVDNDYLIAFTQFTRDYFESDFNARGPFWDKCKMAYENWYCASNPDGERDEKTNDIIVKGFTKEWKCGGPFLLAQLKKSTKLKVPKYDADSDFVPSKKDLW
jgi:hypothetical protein